MIVYVTLHGEFGEGGTVLAIHKTKQAAILDVEVNHLNRQPLRRTKAVACDSVVARWTDSSACDYIEIERWKVRD